MKKGSSILLSVLSLVIGTGVLRGQEDTSIDLSTWVQYGNAGDGTWTVADNKLSVFQTINGGPTYFVSDFDLGDSRFEGTFKVETTSDDDFIGFVFAFNGLGADKAFYLITWKQAAQTSDGASGEEGFKLLKVPGDVTSAEIWDGETTARMTNLAQLVNSTSYGWADNTLYRFELNYQPASGDMRVVIRDSTGSTVLWNTGLIHDPDSLGTGKVGFFNLSQEDVRYSGFTQADLQSPVAVTGGPYVLTATDTAVDLDGSGSSDPDGDAGDTSDLTFQWDVGNDGITDDAERTTVDPTVSRADLIAKGLAIGHPVALGLTVTDVDGLTGEATGEFQYQSTVPVVAAGGPYGPIHQGESVQLLGSASDIDLPIGVGESLTVEWDFTAATTAADIGDGFSSELQPDVPFEILLPHIDGTQVTVYLNVTDAAGLVASSSTTVTLLRPELGVGSLVHVSEAHRGDAIVISWTTTNAGEVATNASWLDAVYISADDQVGDDIRLGEVAQTSVLEVDGSVQHSLQVVIPPDTTAGNRWLIVAGDDTGLVPETQEDNNTAISTPVNIIGEYTYTNLNGGILTGDTTWSGDLLVYGDIHVPADTTLTISAGTRVAFMAHSDDQSGGADTGLSELIVDNRGILRIEGTLEDPVLLTSSAIPAVAGDWGGIRSGFTSASQSVVIGNCTVEGATYGWYHEQNGGDGTLQLTNARFHDNSSSGVYALVHGTGHLAFTVSSTSGCQEWECSGARRNGVHGFNVQVSDSESVLDATVTGAVFADNARSGLLISGETDTRMYYTVSGCVSRGHTTTTDWYYGSGLCVYSYVNCETTGTISGNRVSGNRYGIYRYNYSGQNTVSTTIEDNTAVDNTQRGILYYQYYGYGSDLVLRGNSVSGTTGGPGIEAYRYRQSNSSALVMTVEDNISTGNAGRGIQAYWSSTGNTDITARNNTCSGNSGDGLYLISSLSPSVAFNECNDNGGSGIWVSSGNEIRLWRNQAYGNTTHGIYVAGGGALRAFLNESHDNGQHGLQLSGTGESDILFNSIYANGGDGVRLSASGAVSLNYNNLYGSADPGESTYDIRLVSSLSVDARYNYFGADADVEALTFDRRDAGGESAGFLDFRENLNTLVVLPADPVAMIIGPADGEVLNDGIEYTLSGIAVSETLPFVIEVSVDGGATWSSLTGTNHWGFDWTTPASGTQSLQARVQGSASPADVKTVTIDSSLPTTSGKILTDETWDSTVQGEIVLTGDVTVGAGATLTVMPGTTIKAASFDQYRSGESSSLIEIIVDQEGALAINGSADQPVLLTTTNTVPGAGAWGGIAVSLTNAAAVPLSVSHTTIEYALKGLRATISGWDDAEYSRVIQLDHVTAREITGVGVAVELSGGTGKLALSDVQAESCGSHGIYLHTVSAADWTSTLSNIRCVDNSGSGLYCYHEQVSLLDFSLTSAEGSDETTRSLFSGNGNYGCHINVEDSGSTCDVAISGVGFADNDFSGLLLYGNTSTGLTYAISGNSASGHVATNDWNYGNGICVYTASSCASSGAISGNTVTGNRYGIQRYNYSGQAATATDITGNTADANTQRGILYYQYYGYGADLNIQDNEVTGTTGGPGIEAYRYRSNNSAALNIELSGNTSTGNSGRGIQAYYSSSGTVAIEAVGNTCTGNGSDGLYLVPSSGSACWAYDNDLHNNGSNGLYVSGGAILHAFLNRITGNAVDGVYLASVAAADLLYSTIQDNTGDGIEVHASDLIRVNYCTVSRNFSAGTPLTYEIRNATGFPVDARFNYFGETFDSSLIWDREDDVAVGSVDADERAASAIAEPDTPVARITSPLAGATLNDNDQTISGIAISSVTPFTVEVSTDGGGTWIPATGSTSWTCAWDDPPEGEVSLRSRVTGSSEEHVLNVTIDPNLPTTSGTLSKDETWNPAGGTVVITGDVTVPAGRTLTIAGGTTVLFAQSDDTQGGTDTNRCELIVDGGGLVVAGTEAAPVVFTTDHSTPVAGLWGGITITRTAGADIPLSISYATVQYGLWGIKFNLGSWNDPLHEHGVALDHVDILYTTGTGLEMQLNGGSGKVAVDTLSATFCGTYGIYVHSSNSGVWEASLVDIRCLDNQNSGFYWYNELASLLTLSLTSSEGAEASQASAFSRNTGYGCYVYCEDSGTSATVSVSGADFADNTLSGLLLNGSSDTVLNYTVSGNTASGHMATNNWNYGNGIVVYTYYRCQASGSISDNILSGNRYGIQYYNESGQASVSTLIDSNTASACSTAGIYYYQYYGYGATLTVQDNEVTGTTAGPGIHLQRYRSSNSNPLVITLTGNTSSGNSGRGIQAYWNSYGETGITARNNTCTGNGGDGMYLYATQPLVVTRNTLSNNSGDGIEISSGTSADILYNGISGNTGGHGVNTNGSGVTNINANNITGNASDGSLFEIYNVSAENVDARYNYFGEAPDLPALVYDKYDNQSKGYVDTDHAAGAPVSLDFANECILIKDPVEGADEVIPVGPYTIRGVAVAETGIKRIEVQVQSGGEWFLASGTGHWSYEWDAAYAGEYQARARIVDSQDTLLTGSNTVAFTVSDSVPTTSGSLSKDETWSGDVLVSGDVTVGTGRTLTIAAGSVVRFAGVDDRQSGSDANTCELIVDGGILRIEGSEAEPVLLRPDGDLTTPGQWGGVRVTQTGSGLLLISHCTLEYSTVGIDYALSQGVADIVLDQVTVHDVSGNGIRLQLTGVSGSGSLSDVSVEDAGGQGVVLALSGGSGSFSMDRIACTENASTGLHVSTADSGDWGICIGNVRAEANTGSSSDGLLIEARSGSQAAVSVTHTAVDAFPVSTLANNGRYGIYAYAQDSGSGLDIEIDGIQATGNAFSGIMLQGQDLTSLTYQVNGCEVRNHQASNDWIYGNGVCVYSYSRCQISGCVENCTLAENRLGFQRYGSSTSASDVLDIVSGNTLSNNTSHGIYYYHYYGYGARFVARDNTIRDNQSHGVYINRYRHNGTGLLTVELARNTIADNGGDGFVTRRNYTDDALRVYGFLNEISGNAGDGVDISASHLSYLYDNSISGNGGVAARVVAAAALDARWNYWGETLTAEMTGGSNPRDLTGLYDVYDDSSLGSIQYVPWLADDAVVTDTSLPFSQILDPPDGSVIHGGDRSVSGFATCSNDIDHVEVSLDGGVTWEAADWTSSERIFWTVSWDDVGEGTYELRSRAVTTADVLQDPPASAQITVDFDAATTAGELPGDEIWSGTVTLQGDIVVPAGVTLTIQPGTTVVVPSFQDSTGQNDNSLTEIFVYGSLIAVGTAAERISMAPATGTVTGSWGGIYCTGSLELQFVDVDDADTALAVAHTSGTWQLLLQNNRFRNYSQYGLSADWRSGAGGEIHLFDSLFDGAAGTGAYIFAKETAAIDLQVVGCEFQRNPSRGLYISVDGNNSDASPTLIALLVRNNLFYQNDVNGIYLYTKERTRCDASFENNTIQQCFGSSAYALRVQYDTPPTGDNEAVLSIDGNEIDLNQNGVEIYANSGPLDLSFTNNYVARSTSTGVTLRYAGTGPFVPDVTGNVIKDNSACNLQLTASAATEVHYNELTGSSASLVALQNGSANDIHAENNWWGKTTAEEIAALVYDHADSASLGTVYVDPWWGKYEPPEAPTVDQSPTTVKDVAFALSGTKAAQTGIRVNGQIHVDVDDAGTWSTSTDLSPGRNVLNITAFDALNLVSDPVSLTVTLDTAAPEFIHSDPGNGAWRKYVERIVITLLDRDGTLDDAVVIGSIVVQDATEATVPGSLSEANDQFTFTPDGGPLADGAYEASFTAQDAAGNSAAYSFAFQVDSQPPSAPTITGGATAGGVLQVRPAENYSDATTVSVTGTRDDATSVWVNDFRQVALGSGDWSTTVSLSEGTNTLEIWLEDETGNSSPSVWIDISVDTVPPVILSVTPANGSFLNYTPAAVVATYLEVTSGIDLSASTTEVRNGTGNLIAGSWELEGTDTLRFTPTSPFPETACTVSLQLADQLGKLSTSVQSSFTIDLTAPAAPLIDPVTSPTNNPSQLITGSKEAYAAVLLSGTQIVSHTEAATWEYTVSLNNGVNHFVFSVSDRAGNSSSSSSVDIVYDDIAPPAVTGLIASGAGSGTSVALDWTAYDEDEQGDVSYYRVYAETTFFTQLSSLQSKATVPAGTQSTIVRNLVKGVTYYFAVVAVDTNGNAIHSVTPTSAVPLDSVPPEDVTGLQVQPGATELAFSWTPSVDTAGDLAEYRVFLADDTVGVSLDSDQTGYTANGLDPATAYTFRIKTVDDDANASAGVSITGYTLMPNPDPVNAVGCHGLVELSWTAVEPVANVARYNVYCSEQDFSSVSGMTPRLTSTSPAASVTGLVNGMDYYFAVTTVNKSGGETLEVTTVQAHVVAPDLVPESLVFDPLEAAFGDSLTVSWTVRNTAAESEAAATTVWYDRVWLSADAVFSTQDDMLLGSRSAGAFLPLAAGDAYDGVLTVDLPTTSTLVPGDYYVFLETDGLNAQTETDETNNRMVSASVLPLHRISGPAVLEMTPGGTVNRSVNSVTVTFDKAVKAASFTRADIVLTGPAGSISTNVSAVSETVFRICFSSQVAEGDYSLTLGPHITDKTNNEMDQNGNVVNGEDPDDVFTHSFAISLPDLTVSQVTPGVAAAVFGTSLTLNWVVTNTGSYPATADWVDALWFSQDTEVGSDDTLLATVPAALSSLEANGGFYTGSASVTPPLSQDFAPGTYYFLVSTDTGSALVETSESNNAAASGAVDMSLPALPDLTVTDVRHVTELIDEQTREYAPRIGSPGDTIELAWTTGNTGSANLAETTWTEKVFISKDRQVGSDTLLATFTYTQALDAGAGVERQEDITLPSSGWDGEVYFLVETDAGEAVFESEEENNVAAAADSTLVPATLSLSLSASLPEGTAKQQAIVTRSGATTNPLTVYLGVYFGIDETTGELVPDATELSVPASVIIPRGQKSQSFTVSALTDDVIDGDQTVVVEARADITDGDLANGNGTIIVGIQNVTVIDIDYPVLTLTAPADELTEGEAVAAVLTLDPAPTIATLVRLSTNPSLQLYVPDTVTVEAGTAQTTVDVTAIQDAVVETAGKSVTLSATASGYGSSAKTFTVWDDDSQQIRVTVEPGAVTEGTYGVAAIGTVTRSVITSSSMVLNISVSDPLTLYTESQVLIAADQPSATFQIGVYDDLVSNGERLVDISLVAVDSFTEAELPAVSVSTAVTVLDDDGQGLALTRDRLQISESGTATGTVSRNTVDNSAPLTVTLHSDQPDEATVPESVQILAGAVSANFLIQGVSDDVTDGNQTVTITASASGFNSGSTFVVVSDMNLPDLRIRDQDLLSATAYAGHEFSLAWTVANEGLATASGTWLERIYLSKDTHLDSNDTKLADYRFQSDLAADESYSRPTATFLAPSTPGTYWLLLQVDPLGAIRESLETNNIAVISTPLTVIPAYTATVEVTQDQWMTGDVVTFVGRATDAIRGADSAYVVVTVWVRHDGTVRSVSALTDEFGEFSAGFRLINGEGGYYTIGAAHPGVAAADVPDQDSFTVLGMRPDPREISHELLEGQSVSGQVTVRNLSSIPLSGIMADVEDAPANLTIQAGIDSDLPGDDSLVLNYSIEALDASIQDSTTTVRITSSEGVEIEIPVYVYVRQLVPKLTGPTRLKAGMVRGQRAVWELTITNAGGASTGEMEVMLPQTDWLYAGGDGTISSLDAGEATTITLFLEPGSNLPLGPYTGSIAVGNEDVFLSIPFTFRNVSDAVGDARIIAVDEKTYHDAAAPKVEAASVVLRDPFTMEAVYSGQTDSSGEVLFTDIPEGMYNLEVNVAKHDGFKSTVLVTPGETAEVTAFLRTQLVTYTWKVEPIEIEDRYKVTIETVFATNVPTPVVTVSPNLIDLSTIEGNEGQVVLTVANEGLVAAKNLVIAFPEHSDWEIIPLVSDLGDLPAKSSLSLPVTCRRITARDTDRGTGPCSFSGGIEWELICGPFNIAYPVPIPVVNARGDCFGSSSSGGSWGGGGWGGGWGGSGSGSGSGHGTSRPHYTRPTLSGPTGTYYEPEDDCTCENNGFEPKCLQGSLGVSASAVLSPLEAAFNAVVPPFISLEGMEAEFEASGEICTCCEDSLQGLKVKAELSGSISGTIRAGLSKSLSAVEIETGAGTASIEASIFAGAEGSLSGSGRVYFETDCHLENPRVGFEGSLSASLTIGGEVKGSASIPGIGSGEALGRGGLETGFTVTVSGTTDGGVNAEACFNGATLSAAASAEIKDSNDEVVTSAEADWSYTLFEKKCIGGEGTRGSWQPLRLEDFGLPADPTPDEIARFLGFTSLEHMHRVAEYRQQQSTATRGDDCETCKTCSETTGSGFANIADATAAANSFGSLTTALENSGNIYESVVMSDLEAETRRQQEREEIQAAASRGGDEGICAQVKLLIEQEVTMTRRATAATLEITNGSTTSPLSNLSVDIAIYDEDYNLVNDRFVVLDPTTSNLTQTSTGEPPDDFDPLTDPPYFGLPEWQAPPDSTASLRWVILPTEEAAPDGPTLYRIGGTLNYSVDGVSTTAQLVPGPVTVLPDAKLDLRYFHQRDVYSDDPFTEETEASEPYSLAIMVINKGKGDANDFRITSAQPQIIENVRGLLIDFTIIATEVGGESLTPSLTADFGTIPADSIAIARWLFKSSLQGHFIEYEASFEHEDALGGTVTSLIDTVEIHELIHLIQASGDFADGEYDFLVNDIEDDDFLPDTLYLSDGQVEPVALGELVGVDAPVSPGHLSVVVTLSQPAGWSYVRFPDPGAGEYNLVTVQRSDRSSVPVGVNAWQTDRTFIEVDKRPVYEDVVHLVDYDGPGTYTFVYAPLDNAGPQILSLDQPDGPVITAPDELEFTLSEIVDLTTLTTADFGLSRDGGSDLLAEGDGLGIEQVEDTVYRVTGLAAYMTTDGEYRLYLSMDAVSDLFGNTGSGSAEAVIRLAAGGPAVRTITGLPEEATAAPIAEFSVRFSRAVAAGTFGREDIRLTYEGGTNLIDDRVLVTQTDADTFTVSNLSELTAVPGNYEIQIDASGVKDLLGAAGIGSETASWLLDAVGPQLEKITRTGGDTITFPISGVTCYFTDAIDRTTFTPDDLVLSRNGGSNLIGEEVSIRRVVPSIYRVMGLESYTAQNGVYELTIDLAGITDAAGIAVTGDGTISWTVDTGDPDPPTNLAVTPDSGVSGTDGITRFLQVTLTGTLAESGMSVQIEDALSGVPLKKAEVTGTSFSGSLQLETAGTQKLQLVTSDSAGNSTTSTYEFFVDVQAPAVAGFLGVPGERTVEDVDTVQVVLSEAPVNGTFSLDSISLTKTVGDVQEQILLQRRDVVLEPLSGDSRTFRLTGLSSLTGETGVYTLTADAAGVEDSAGNVGSGSRSTSWQRVTANTAPTVVLGITSYAVSEGTEIVVSGTVTDPDNGPWSGTIDFGCASCDTEELTLEGDSQPTFSHTLLVPDGDEVLYGTVRIEDAEGGETFEEFEVNVSNVSPELTLFNADKLSGFAGEVFTVYAHAVDPANSDDYTRDPLVYRFDFGDGRSYDEVKNETGSHEVSFTAAASHTFTQTGEYEVSVQVQDDDGGVSAVRTLTIVIIDPFELEIYPGWNLVSTPVTLDDPDLTTVFSGLSLTGPAWAWDPVARQYFNVTQLQPGQGVWLFFFDDSRSGPVSVPLPGSRAPSESLETGLQAGWNLFGPVLGPASAQVLPFTQGRMYWRAETQGYLPLDSAASMPFGLGIWGYVEGATDLYLGTEVLPAGEGDDETRSAEDSFTDEPR